MAKERSDDGEGAERRCGSSEVWQKSRSALRHIYFLLISFFSRVRDMQFFPGGTRDSRAGREFSKKIILFRCDTENPSRQIIHYYWSKLTFLTFIGFSWNFQESQFGLVIISDSANWISWCHPENRRRSRFQIANGLIISQRE